MVGRGAKGPRNLVEEEGEEEDGSLCWMYDTVIYRAGVAGEPIGSETVVVVWRIDEEVEIVAGMVREASMDSPASESASVYDL